MMQQNLETNSKIHNGKILVMVDVSASTFQISSWYLNVINKKIQTLKDVDHNLIIFGSGARGIDDHVAGTKTFEFTNEKLFSFGLNASTDISTTHGWFGNEKYSELVIITDGQIDRPKHKEEFFKSMRKSGIKNVEINVCLNPDYVITLFDMLIKEKFRISVFTIDKNEIPKKMMGRFDKLEKILNLDCYNEMLLKIKELLFNGYEEDDKKVENDVGGFVLDLEQVVMNYPHLEKKVNILLKQSSETLNKEKLIQPEDDFNTMLEKICDTTIRRMSPLDSAFTMFKMRQMKKNKRSGVMNNSGIKLEEEEEIKREEKGKINDVDDAEVDDVDDDAERDATKPWNLNKKLNSEFSKLMQLNDPTKTIGNFDYRLLQNIYPYETEKSPITKTLNQGIILMASFEKIKRITDPKSNSILKITKRNYDEVRKILFGDTTFGKLFMTYIIGGKYLESEIEEPIWNLYTKDTNIENRQLLTTFQMANLFYNYYDIDYSFKYSDFLNAFSKANFHRIGTVFLYKFFCDVLGKYKNGLKNEAEEKDEAEEKEVEGTWLNGLNEAEEDEKPQPSRISHFMNWLNRRIMNLPDEVVEVNVPDEAEIEETEAEIEETEGEIEENKEEIEETEAEIEENEVEIEEKLKKERIAKFKREILPMYEQNENDAYCLITQQYSLLEREKINFLKMFPEHVKHRKTHPMCELGFHFFCQKILSPCPQKQFPNQVGNLQNEKKDGKPEPIEEFLRPECIHYHDSSICPFIRQPKIIMKDDEFYIENNCDTCNSDKPGCYQRTLNEGKLVVCSHYLSVLHLVFNHLQKSINRHQDQEEDFLDEEKRKERIYEMVEYINNNIIRNTLDVNLKSTKIVCIREFIDLTNHVLNSFEKLAGKTWITKLEKLNTNHIFVKV